MFRPRLSCLLVPMLVGGFAASLPAQTPPAPPAPLSPQAQSYTEFALGKWAELQAENRGGGTYVQQALQHSSSAMSADPHSAYIAAQTADLLARLGRVAEATTLMDTVVKEHPDSIVAHQTLGRIYLGQLNRERQPIAPTVPAMQRAVAEYQALVRLQPRDAESVVVLGKLYGAQGNAVEAEHQFRAALALAPTNVDAVASLVQSLASQGRLDEAGAAVAALPPVAHSAQVYAILGEAYANHHDYGTAANAYQEAVAAQPDVPEYREALAKALMDGGRYAEALAAYQGVERLAPGNGDAALRTGQLEMQLGQLEAAAASLRRARPLLGPDNLELAYAEALLASAQGHDAAAADALRGLVARKTGPATASIFLAQLARVEMRSGQAQDAAARLQAMAALGPEYRGRAHALAIELYSQQRDFAHALEAVRAALADEPASRPLHLTEANLLAASGQTAAAKADVRALLQGNASDWDLYLALGQIDAQARDWSQARQETARADQLAASPAEHARAVAQLAGLANRQRDYAAAEQDYRRALALDPQNPTILNGLGYTLAERGTDLAQALGFVRQALARDANNGAYLDSLGWVYFKMNRLSEAVTNLEHAARLEQHDPAILDHLAQAYEGDGKLQQAESSWQQALDDLKLNPAADSGAERSRDIRKKLSAVRDRIAQKQ